jgi:hypothetical protein
MVHKSRYGEQRMSHALTQKEGARMQKGAVTRETRHNMSQI